MNKKRTSRFELSLESRVLPFVSRLHFSCLATLLVARNASYSQNRTYYVLFSHACCTLALAFGFVWSDLSLAESRSHDACE